MEQGEEEAMLQQYREEAARKSDLSPMHNGKRKKTSTRDKSWDGRQCSYDGKATQEVALRKPPMRNAKQKASVPTTSAKSNKSKKMIKFEEYLKKAEEEAKELQLEECTSFNKYGKDSIFYIVLFYHFLSIIICNIITEYAINSVMITKYLVLASFFFLHAC